MYEYKDSKYKEILIAYVRKWEGYGPDRGVKEERREMNGSQ